jgi:hypothetical protein
LDGIRILAELKMPFLRRDPSKSRTRLSASKQTRRFIPRVEQLECRTLLSSTVIVLDSSGSGTQTGTILRAPHGTNTQDQYTFTAPVTGRISVLMRAESAGFISQLTAPGTTTLDSAVFASTLDVAGDDVVQFHVDAGSTYQLVATGGPTAQIPPVSSTGNYELIISTETADFSATTVHPLALDATGAGLQLGTIETPGEVDTYSFAVPVTGQTTVRVNGGVTGQVTQFLTTAGQSFEVQVSDASNKTGLYVMTVTSIADDYPDSEAFTIALDATGTGTKSGVINYAGDVDVFHFTAPVSGTMMLTMHTPDLSGLQSDVAVGPATVTYQVAPSVRSLASAPANDQILRFHVDQGVQYTMRASGANGSSGAYQLSFSMPVDDDSATTPQVIDLNASGVGSQSGSIVIPGDQDLYQFTANADGYMLVALNSIPGTNLQGSLTFPSTTFPTTPALLTVYRLSGVSMETTISSGVGWLEAARDQFAVIQVNQGQTYQFLVSGDGQSIGAYNVFLVSGANLSISDANLTISTNDTGDQAFVQTTGEYNPFRPSDSAGVHTRRSLTFNFSSDAPGVFETDLSVAPESESSQVSSTSTNTRVAAFALSSSTGNSPSTGTSGGDSGGNTTSGTVTVPSGTSVQGTNSLIATLLTVAARDSAVQSSDSAVAATLPSNLSSAVATSLLVSLVAGSSGGGDMGTVTVIAGSVFEDRNGNGRLDAGEPGVSGETIVLEMRKGDQYVVVGKTSTDATGAFAFAGMPAGDYRVRCIGSGLNLTTPASYPVQVTSGGTARIVNFGRAAKRGQTLAPREQPFYCRADSDGPGLAEAVDRAFWDWHENDSVPAVLDAHERAANDWWLGLLSLAPAAMLGMVWTSSAGSQQRKQMWGEDWRIGEPSNRA